MEKVKYYYIHGFNSNGVRTYNLLKSTINKNVDLLGYDSQKDFHFNLEELSKKVDKNSYNVFVATSLGCYYARALAEINFAELKLFNPCFNPQKILPKLGLPTKLAKTYDFKPNLSLEIPSTIFVSSEDEVIPNNINTINNIFNGYAEIIEIKGTHRIQDFSKYKEKILTTFI